MTEAIDRIKAALRNRYRFDGEIGRGGMATVYRARDLKHDRDVAIKVLRPDLSSELANDRFLREISVVAKLQHPHVVSLIDSGAVDELLYYVMPLIQGESLRSFMTRTGQVDIQQTVVILRDVLAALHYAHRHGVIHRDIKPENILLHEAGPMITDFGVALAVSASENPNLTGDGYAVGTPKYMSPEQASANVSVDGRADVFAVACIAYEMLVGESAFGGTTIQEIIAKRFVTPAPSVREQRDDVPVEVDEVLRRAMALSPDDRYATASDFRDALAEAIGWASTSTEVPVRRWPHHTRWGLAAVVLAGLVAAGWGLHVRRDLPVDLDATRLAILPFAVRGCDRLAYLDIGLVDLLSRTLDGAADLRTVDPYAVQSATDRLALSAPIALTDARRAATRLGAGRLVVGSVFGLGTSCRLSASLYETSGDRLATAETDIADEQDLAGAVNRLGLQLLTGTYPGTAIDLGGLADATTESVPALKALLRGLAEVQRGRITPGVTAFRQAVAHDSTFSLAWYWLTVALEWTDWHFGEGLGARRLLDPARRHADRLPARERSILEAFAAYAKGDPALAEETATEVIATYPRETEAWYVLGETLFHHNPVRRRSVIEARGPFERVINEQPRHAPALYHLIQIAALLGDREAIDTLARRFAGLDDPSVAPFRLAVRELRHVATGAREHEFARDLGEAGLVTLQALTDLLAGWHDPGPLDSVARILSDSVARPAVRGLGYTTRLAVALATGRAADVRTILTQASNAGAQIPVFERRLLSVLTPESVARSSFPRNDPGDVNARLAPRRGGTAGESPTPPQPLLWYVDAILAMRLGDSTLAAALADSLKTGQPLGAVQADVGRAIDADLLWGRGHVDSALALVQGPTPAWYGPQIEPWSTRPRERFRRAELLEAAGHPHDAVRWYLTFDATSVGQLPFVPLANRRAVQLLLTRGDTVAAQPYIERYQRWWDANEVPP